jgi:trehalose 2-sulfotransferase
VASTCGSLKTLDAVLLLHGYRTGSNFVASVLAANGFGRPAEHFNADWQTAVQGLNIDEARTTAVQTIHKCSAAGIFGCKLPLPDFLRLARAIGDWSDPIGSIVHCFRQCSVIYLHRQDIFLQAVSAWRAQSTGEWWRYRSAADFPLPPTYDEGGIYEKYLYLCREEYMWQEFFARSEVSPLRIAYEDIDENANQLIDLMSKLAARIDPDRTSISRAFQISSENVKQRDEMSYAYRSEFVRGLMRAYAG